MQPLLDNFLQLVGALWGLLTSLVDLLAPWLPLAAWCGFWTFGVDWTRLRRILLQGGWIGLLLIGLVMILVWGTVAPPAGGRHVILTLSLSNFVGKTVYTTTLFVLMFLCGSVQLSGCCGNLCSFPEDEPEDHGHGGHGHGGHGHDAHGEAAPAHASPAAHGH